MNRREFFRRSLKRLGVSNALPDAVTGDPSYQAGLQAMRSGRASQAEAHLRRAVKNYPDQAAGLHLLALCLYKQKKWEETQDILDRLLALDEESGETVILLQGLVLACRDRPAEAVDAWKAFSDSTKTTVLREINLCRAMVETGQPFSGHEAARSMEEAMQKSGLLEFGGNFV
jgi:tetratricopeptide (TPR) repeat protein